MPNILTWALLPAGIDPATGRARLSLAASPEATSTTGRLADSALADWPTHVAGLAGTAGALALQVEGTKNPVPLTLTSPLPRQDLWDLVFPPDAPVDPPDSGGGIAALLEPMATAVAYDQAHTAAAGLYEQVLRTSPTDALGPDHPVARAVAAFGRLTAAVSGGVAARAAAGVPTEIADLLDPERLSTARVGRAVRALADAGLDAEAAVAPLVPLVVRQRQAAETAEAQRASATSPTPSPVDPIRPLHLADVHQVIGLIGDHPALARLLGLVVDFEIPSAAALVGERSIRIVASGGAPLAHLFDTVRIPWSRVQLDPAAGRFHMAPSPEGPGEIRRGQLDLRPDGAEYMVGDIDVRSVARQLALVAVTNPGGGARITGEGAGTSDSDRRGVVPQGAPAAGGTDGVVLPVRRDPGFTVAQSGRRQGVVAASLALAKRVEQADAARAAGTAVPDLTLYADDVTSGYRVDVERDAQPFRSIMRRVATYRLAGEDGHGGRNELVVHDEGVVEPIVPVVEKRPDGSSSITIGEETFAWNGWSVAAPLPGPVVTGEAAGEPTVGEPGAETLDGYGLAVATAVEPGSLPALRYGSTYRFRARAVDLAGNSLPESVGDDDLATAPVKFRRHEPVPPPTLVPRTPFRAGQTLTRFVVTSDGDGHVLDATCERHLAPPSSPQQMAERHGVFDAAFGPDTPERAAARAALLTVASREAGSFTDPTVPGPNGTTVPARGIAVVAPPGDVPATLPLPAGTALPAGQYVIHDTDSPVVPYLPDPGASGAVLMSDPALGPEGFFATYGGGRWPASKAIRLVARAVTQGDFDVRTLNGPGGQVLDVALRPGDHWDAAVASTIHPSVVDVMDALPANVRGLAIDGWVLAFSPRQRIQMLHATRRPAKAPTLAVSAPPERKRGATTFEVAAQLGVDGTTTGSVDAVATWTEVTDHGVGPLEVDERRVVLDSRVVARNDTNLSATLRHDFGDTRRRDVTLTPVAATRFGDLFPELPVGHPDTLRPGAAKPVTVTSTRLPAPPKVHSVVPTYAWTRTLTNGTYTSERTVAGLRVYLRRPWLTTGPGEQLGVVTYATSLDAKDAFDLTSAATHLVSRSAVDPLEEAPPGRPVLRRDRFLAETAVPFTPLELPAMAPANPPHLVAVAHDVHFDEDRGLWYADVAISPSPVPWRHLLRLSLTRLQTGAAPDLSRSRLTMTDWVPIAATQKLTVVRTGPDAADVTVHNLTDDRFYQASLAPRLRPRPPGAPKEVGEMDVVVADAAKQTLIQSAGKAKTTIKITATDPVQRERLAQGRLSVRELQSGEDIRKPGSASRPLWVETLDWADLFG